MFAILCSKLSQQQNSSSKSKVFLKHPLSIEQLPLAPQPGGGVHPKVAQIALRRDKGDKEDKGEKKGNKI